TDVNAAEADGTTALHWASYRDDIESADLLIRAGARVNTATDLGVTPLWTASLNASEPMVRRLLQAGANPNAALLLGETPVLAAAGANVKDEDAWGVSATTLAAHAGHRDVVAFLLEHGADPNASRVGFTALHAAIMRRDERMVAALLAHGADAGAPLRTWTPTRRSSKDFHFSPELVGATPIWLAARFGGPAVMRLLLEHGADPLFVHHGDHVVEGRGGTGFQH